MWIIADFASEIIEARKQQSDIFKILQEKPFNQEFYFF